MKKNQKHKNYSISFDALDEQTKELYNGIYDEFDRISIYELREVARRMGVRSATTMDKKTLVKAVTDFRMASTIYCPPTRTLVAPIKLREVEDITSDYLKKRAIVAPETRKGILDFDEQGAWLRVKGFVKSDGDVFVPMLMVNDSKLLPGDEIEGSVRFMEDSGRFGLFKIETLNGQKPGGFQRRHLGDATPPTNIIQMPRGSRIFNAAVAVTPFCKGQRRLIIGLNALKLDSLAREISSRFSENGFSTINLFLDEAHENLKKTEALEGENLVLPCENHQSFDDAINLAVNYAKRVAAYGRDFVIILNNADVLREDTLREVYAAGKCTEEGSITTIIVSGSLSLSESINRLSRTANAITVFKNNFCDDPLIDLSRSFSDSERELSPAHIQTLRDCRKQFGDQFVSVREFNSAFDIILAGNSDN